MYSNATKENINYLASLTGIPKEICHAWIFCEAQSEENHSPTNPLNIPYEGSPRPLQINQINGNAIYDDVGSGLADAWAIIRTKKYERFLAAILTQDNEFIVNELIASPWNREVYQLHMRLFLNKNYPLWDQ